MIRTQIYRHKDDWVVIEHSPRRITVPTRQGAVISVPVPWMVYLWAPPRAGQVDNNIIGRAGRAYMKIFCRPQPLADDDEMLYYAHLPHIYRHGEPCSGAQGGANPFESVDKFWLTGWMERGGYYGASNPSLLPPEAPQAISQLEKFTPQQLLEWHWKEAGTIEALCNRTARGY